MVGRRECEVMSAIPSSLSGMIFPDYNQVSIYKVKKNVSDISQIVFTINTTPSAPSARVLLIRATSIEGFIKSIHTHTLI